MSILEYFRGKKILITGGTGFIGKCLIEKLLRSCDGVHTIYVLLREKKGKTPEERIKTIFEDGLFDELKRTKPEVLSKLVPIAGDVIELNLGLNENDRQDLVENVNIIYHGAASIRFNDFLKKSILINTRGTKELVELALQMKNLEAFIHISTGYCNVDKRRYQDCIKEELYPPPADWREALALAESPDSRTLEILSEKYIDPSPNTYTFTKALSEHVVNDLCRGKIPTIIIRPTVVISTMEDPVSGWTDNVNGAMGIGLAVGKGLLKVLKCNKNSRLNYIPVDVLVKMMLMATRETAVYRNLDDIRIYNAGAIEISQDSYLELGNRAIWEAPFEQIIWFPKLFFTENWILFYLLILFQQILPALILDGVLKLTGSKPIMIMLNRKIFMANLALMYFMTATINFQNDRFVEFASKAIDSEKQTFGFNYPLVSTDEEVYQYFKLLKVGVAKYLLKINCGTKKAYRNTLIFWILDNTIKVSITLLGLWIITVKYGLIQYLTSIIQT